MTLSEAYNSMWEGWIITIIIIGSDIQIKIVPDLGTID